MDKEFFSNNRSRVCQELSEGVVLLSAFDKMQQTNDASGPYIQESNFWWLTGIDLPGWQLLLDCSSGEAALVEPELTASEKLFESYYTQEQASELSGVSTFISSTELLERMKTQTVYALKPLVTKEMQFTPNPAQQRIWRAAQRQTKQVQDVRRKLATLRAIKQPQEITMIQRAIDLTVDSFARIAPLIPTLTTEAEVAAEFSYDFLKQGATHAYEPIVAAGENACTLHYVRNDAPLNGLVLIDIGARVGGYNADLTRTYSHAQPTARQSAVHSAVREAHAQIIALLRPGLAVREYIESVDAIMTSALVELGLMSDKTDVDKYRRYFPHAISHGLGVDVHDSLGGAEVFKSGMLLTVEPGIYIPEESIGVRIEDDILITENGSENLSGKLRTVL